MNSSAKYFLLHLAVLLFLLPGCVPKPLEIDVDQAPPRLVVTSRVVPDQTMLVSVTKSFSALIQEDETDDLLDQLLVERARVTISYRDQVDTLFHADSGFYVSLNTPQFINENYTLSVFDSASGLSISAQSKMLERVDFDSISLSTRIDGIDTAIFYELSFADVPGENFYLLSVYRKLGEKRLDIPENFGPEQGEVLTETVVLSDREFKETYSLRGELEGFNLSDTVAFSLSNVSETYYDYLVLRGKSETSLTSLITQEPISYPTNVEGGYGFFLTQNPDIRVFDLNELR